MSVEDVPVRRKSIIQSPGVGDSNKPLRNASLMVWSILGREEKKKR